MKFNIFKPKEKEKRSITSEQTNTHSTKNYTHTTHSNISEKKKISAVQTCLKILSENISRIPVSVINNDNIKQQHYINQILNTKPNNYQNANTFWSIIEYHRNYYGNAFVIINRNLKGLVSDLQIVHPNDFVNYTFATNQLYFIFRIGGDKQVINCNDVLHFRCQSEYIIAESPLYSLANSLNISKKAGDTLNNFYENNAMSPMVLKSNVNDVANGKLLKERVEQIIKDNASPDNAGKLMVLPPNTELSQLQLKFVDADTIPTLKFTRDEISAAFGIANYMLNDSDSTQNIEQLSLQFRTFTIEPILDVYAKELQFKLLTSKEIEAGIKIKHNSNVLIESDLKTKAEAYKTLVVNGLATPNEVIKLFGFEPIDSINGDKHYIQQQYIQLEKYELQSLTNNNINGTKENTTKTDNE